VAAHPFLDLNFSQDVIRGYDNNEVGNNTPWQAFLLNSTLSVEVEWDQTDGEVVRSKKFTRSYGRLLPFKRFHLYRKAISNHTHKWI